MAEPRAGGAADVRAPGTLESHYAPSARVLLVESDAATPAGLDAVVRASVRPPRP